MYPVYGDVAEKETQGKEGPAGERMCGPGQTPQCGEIINPYNLDSYLPRFVGHEFEFLKYSLLHIFLQSLRWFQLVSYLFTIFTNIHPCPLFPVPFLFKLLNELS